MRNIYINEAESIFEQFWDSGDTYTNHEKYSCMEKYKVQGDGNYKIGWKGVQVFTTGTFILSRDLNLDISDFDTLILCMNLPEGMNVNVRAVIDGETKVLINGVEDLYEFEGSISGEKLTHIELEFVKVGLIHSFAILYWIGLANSQRRSRMLERKNGYEADCWEGCFKEDFEIKPHLSAYFDEQELEVIRKKVTTGEFAEIFHELEKRAKTYLDCDPERYIGDYVAIKNSELCRRRDTEVMPTGGMVTLAFVGIIKKDKEMLKMACRIALSTACCRYWCEGVRGVFPGATWHHRSFLEGALALSCSKVLDWAGEALTWHGRNIIYDAIIMKGLPRLEADIYTMDYIWHMNQGIVFSAMLIPVLLVLGKRYPRYVSLAEKYEGFMREMWENYVNADGGAGEGPAYWSYSATYFMRTLYYLARNKGKTLEEYTPQSLKKAEQYVKGMLSTVGDGAYLLPLNDTRMDKVFDLLIPVFYANAGSNQRFWSSIFAYSLKDVSKLTLLDDLLIMAKSVESGEETPGKEGYIQLKETGVVSLVRESKEVGRTAIFVQGGLAELGGHEHEDKGSFVIEAGGEGLMIDRGTCIYSDSNSGAFATAKWHNVLYPEVGNEAHQIRCTAGCYGKILKSQYADGCLECVVDVTTAWDGIFRKNIRTIISPDPRLYIIHDSIDCDCDVSFRANTYGKMEGNIIECNHVKMYVHTLNWTPHKMTCEPDGADGNGIGVNQLRLYGKGSELITILELAKDESRVQITDNLLKYFGMTIEWKNGKINIK